MLVDAQPVRLRTGVIASEPGDSFPLALLGWVSGCIMIWSALFTVGNFLYGRNEYGFGLLAVFLISSAVLIGVVRRIWK